MVEAVEALRSRGTTQEWTIADLAEGTWGVANICPDVFCMELATWEITAALASEIPNRFRVDQLGFGIR